MENIKTFTKKLFNKINETKNICLFVHYHPDCDALGSAYALKKFIELNFKGKDVRIAGITSECISYLPKFFHDKCYLNVNDEFINNSISILFDVANYDRVLQKNYFKFKNSFRIDHHIYVEKICENELININASSTCELVGLIMMESKLKINSEIANSLYFGILTDTIRFSTSNVNKNTYLLMSYLVKKTFVDKEMVHNQLYLKSLSDLKLDRKFFKLIKFKKNYAYLMFSKKNSNKYDNNILKTKLYLMAGIDSVKIYALLYWDKISKFYRCSLRSRDIDVNIIAKKFSGGGHKYASGCKINDKKEFKLLEKEIKKAVSNIN